MAGKPKEPRDHEPRAILRYRLEAGLTQAALAERTGVSLSLINMIEGGSRNATPEMLAALADALGCPVAVLERKDNGDSAAA